MQLSIDNYSSIVLASFTLPLSLRVQADIMHAARSCQAHNSDVCTSAALYSIMCKTYKHEQHAVVMQFYSSTVCLLYVAKQWFELMCSEASAVMTVQLLTACKCSMAFKSSLLALVSICSQCAVSIHNSGAAACRLTRAESLEGLLTAIRLSYYYLFLMLRLYKSSSTSVLSSVHLQGLNMSETVVVHVNYNDVRLYEPQHCRSMSTRSATARSLCHKVKYETHALVSAQLCLLGSSCAIAVAGAQAY
eukprot:17104-Heterococcus_DN1.PRE.2